MSTITGMSDADIPVSRLTPADHHELRDLLEASKGEMERLLELGREAEKPVAVDSSIGRLTRMDALQQQSMAQATGGKGALRLRQIVAALGRMDEGSYGDCLGCQEPIPVVRLRVRPEATLCITCQTAREERS